MNGELVLASLRRFRTAMPTMMKADATRLSAAARSVRSRITSAKQVH